MKEKDPKKLYKTVVIIAVITSALLIAALIYAAVSEKVVPTVRTETVILLLIAMVFLPVTLLTLIILAKKLKSEGGGDVVLKVAGGSIPVAAPVAAADGLVKRGSAEDADEDRRRFYSLSNIDAEYKKYQRESYDKGITLKNFCESFRAFSCSELNLYYSIEDIMRFVAGLAVSKLIILQGMSNSYPKTRP